MDGHGYYTGAAGTQMGQIERREGVLYCMSEGVVDECTCRICLIVYSTKHNNSYAIVKLYAYYNNNNHIINQSYIRIELV